MYKKYLFKKFIIGLLAASITSAAKMNCKKFNSTTTDIEINKCIENKKGRIISLDIDGLITDELIEKIITLDYLEEFKFYHPSYQEDFDLTPLKNLENLTSLEAVCYRHPKHKSSGSEIKKKSFDGLKKLQKLKIRGCEVLGEQAYIGLTNLKEL
ncbi:hypothetical protein PIROE2DRAFT_3420 [Piromyces sp. E2]|nr:hypothetical protein PIROE2DRAFT_3420 [Piromyces sp. E2]|eukprot:OUM68735.1 hypothetical protein PIROE2DRAFT_3420 [Piromyces sp. E2]